MSKIGNPAVRQDDEPFTAKIYPDAGNAFELIANVVFLELFQQRSFWGLGQEQKCPFTCSSLISTPGGQCSSNRRADHAQGSAASRVVFYNQINIQFR